MPTVGILGRGSFGTFVAQALRPVCDIVTAGKDSSDDELAAIGGADYIVLAVPFDAYVDAVKAIEKYLLPTTVIIDACSVKVLPAELLKELLPDQPKVITHPLFGPQSASKSLVGHRLVVCPQEGGEKYEQPVIDFCKKLGLVVTQMSADEHDKLMAELQGLTFFVARILALNGVGRKDIMTPSYERLVELAELEKEHSPELFATIQLANPYVFDVQQEFMKTAERLLAAEQGTNHA